MDTRTPVSVRVAVVAPLYTPPFVMLLHEPPPLVLSCHWKLVAAADVMLKLVLVPTQIVCGFGWAVIEGPAPGLTMYVRITDLISAPAVPVMVTG